MYNTYTYVYIYIYIYTYTHSLSLYIYVYVQSRASRVTALARTSCPPACAVCSCLCHFL